MQVNLKKKQILITGGTGTLGKILIKKLLRENDSIDKLIILSRDELRQSKLMRQFQGNKTLKFIIGDVRDREKLLKEFKGIDFVVHAAAMKHLDICENNPEETFKTNVEGTANVIEAALSNGVKKVLFISTDKAAEPISVYGHSKAQAEELILAAANKGVCSFSILRIGNIFKSRGSVFKVFKEQSRQGTLTLFDKRSTRFLIKNKKLYNSLFFSLTHSLNSAVVIPKLPVFRVSDLADVYCSGCKTREFPLRKGERVHEYLFSAEEIADCYEDEEYFYLLKNKLKKEETIKNLSLKKVTIGSPVSSETGPFLTPEQLASLIFKKSFNVQPS